LAGQHSNFERRNIHFQGRYFDGTIWPRAEQLSAPEVQYCNTAVSIQIAAITCSVCRRADGLLDEIEIIQVNVTVAVHIAWNGLSK
jgi:hypothetical protein